MINRYVLFGTSYINTALTETWLGFISTGIEKLACLTNVRGVASNRQTEALASVISFVSVVNSHHKHP